MPESVSFQGVLEQLRDGQLVDELNVRLGQLLDAVRATEHKGRLTLTLVLEPSSADTSITVVDDLVVSLPQPRKTTVLFKADLPRLPLDDGEPDGRTRSAGADA